MMTKMAVFTPIEMAWATNSTKAVLYEPVTTYVVWEAEND